MFSVCTSWCPRFKFPKLAQFTPITSIYCWVYGGYLELIGVINQQTSRLNGAPPCMFLHHATHRCGKSLSVWQTGTHRGCAEDKAAALPCRSLRYSSIETRVGQLDMTKKDHDSKIFQRKSHDWISLKNSMAVISIVIPQWLPVFLESLAAASPAQQWSHKGLRQR